MLTLLPDLTYPITSKQADAMLNNMVQLNVLEAHLTERQQRGLGRRLALAWEPAQVRVWVRQSIRLA